MHFSAGPSFCVEAIKVKNLSPRKGHVTWPSHIFARALLLSVHVWDASIVSDNVPVQSRVWTHENTM